jgi:hypothetical protein
MYVFGDWWVSKSLVNLISLKKESSWITGWSRLKVQVDSLSTYWGDLKLNPIKIQETVTLWMKSCIENNNRHLEQDIRSISLDPCKSHSEFFYQWTQSLRLCSCNTSRHHCGPSEFFRHKYVTTKKWQAKGHPRKFFFCRSKRAYLI